jgi:hypothetical protein
MGECYLPWKHPIIFAMGLLLLGDGQWDAPAVDDVFCWDYVDLAFFNGTQAVMGRMCLYTNTVQCSCICIVHFLCATPQIRPVASDKASYEGLVHKYA